MGAIEKEGSAINPFPMGEDKTYKGMDREIMPNFLSSRE